MPQNVSPLLTQRKYRPRAGAHGAAAGGGAIDDCSDLGMLARWLHAAFGAQSAEALRAALFG